jgi:hypothetical protein
MMPSANALLRRAILTLAAIAALVAFCLALIVVRSRKASRQAANQMRLTFSAEKPVLDHASQRERQRDAVLSKNLAEISRAVRSAKKPADLAKRLPAAFPPLPRPLSISFPPSAPVTADQAAEAPAIITVPQADLKPLFDQLETCHACQEQLATAQQDLNDERAKVSALTIERDAAVKAARGGGFWTRFRTGVKWFAIGGTMGALAASAARR